MFENFDMSSISKLSGNFDELSRNMTRLQIVTRETGHEFNKTFGDALSKNINRLIKGTTTFKEALKDTARTIAQDFIQRQIGRVTDVGGGKGSTLGKIIGGIGKMFFSSGGIVPGSFSQPVPIVAHGSEMILNPGQQANLFKMLNGKAKGGGQAGFVYAPQVTTGASAAEVFDVLNRHSRQFFSMVADGVQKDSSLRNSVRGAR